MEQTNSQQASPVLPSLPYPGNPALKVLFRSPLLLWRLGLGPLVGQLFMILTTTGRKSGLPRHTAIEYHTWRGRKYAVAAWPQSDWYRNLQADPLVTVQTAAGTESAIARRLTDDQELAEVYAFINEKPTLRRVWQMLGFDFDMTLEGFLAEKDRFHLLTFDRSDKPGPTPLAVDLPWVWLVVPAIFLLAWRGRRK